MIDITIWQERLEWLREYMNEKIDAGAVMRWDDDTEYYERIDFKTFCNQCQKIKLILENQKRWLPK